MALLEINANNQSEKEGTKGSDKKEKPLTKIIVRRLPPGITQEEFLQQVSPVPEYDYIYTVKGDLNLGENAFSRVYMNFTKPEDIYFFKEKFDNYVFVDAKGHEYPAVVEYASFQKVPKRRKPRPDPKVGTIESDPVYLEFLESLTQQPNQEEKPEYSYQPSTNDKNDITTPLLDYLKQRKIDRLRLQELKREERRKKEMERKKMREDDRRKRVEEKPTAAKPKAKDKDVEVKIKDESEKPEKPFPKNKERKYDDKKPAGKTKYSKYEDKKDFKRREEFREYPRKFEEKKEFPKKVKKYSERREERKNEATKADEKSSEAPAVPLEPEKETKHEIESKEEEFKSSKHKDGDPRTQRRIRNKDRPTMALYKPGMLRKKSVESDDKERSVEKDQ